MKKSKANIPDDVVPLIASFLHHSGGLVRGPVGYEGIIHFVQHTESTRPIIEAFRVSMKREWLPKLDKSMYFYYLKGNLKKHQPPYPKWRYKRGLCTRPTPDIPFGYVPDECAEFVNVCRRCIFPMGRYIGINWEACSQCLFHGNCCHGEREAWGALYVGSEHSLKLLRRFSEEKRKYVESGKSLETFVESRWTYLVHIGSEEEFRDLWTSWVGDGDASFDDETSDDELSDRVGQFFLNRI